MRSRKRPYLRRADLFLFWQAQGAVKRVCWLRACTTLFEKVFQGTRFLPWLLRIRRRVRCGLVSKLCLDTSPHLSLLFQPFMDSVVNYWKVTGRLLVSNVFSVFMIERIRRRWLQPHSRLSILKQKSFRRARSWEKFRATKERECARKNLPKNMGGRVLVIALFRKYGDNMKKNFRKKRHWILMTLLHDPFSYWKNIPTSARPRRSVGSIFTLMSIRIRISCKKNWRACCQKNTKIFLSSAMEIRRFTVGGERRWRTF